MIPIVARTTEESLKLVPHTLREASMALGIPRWKTITLDGKKGHALHAFFIASASNCFQQAGNLAPRLCGPGKETAGGE